MAEKIHTRRDEWISLFDDEFQKFVSLGRISSSCFGSSINCAPSCSMVREKPDPVMPENYDIVVIGAGIIGSCAAYHCQKLGLKTLLLEQNHLGHVDGSSHGKSRIIRYAHTDAPYIPIVDDAYKQIDELQIKRREQLWLKTGLLWFGSHSEVDEISSVLKTSKIEHEVWPGELVKHRFHQFDYDSSWKAIFDPMGGVILADRWLAAFQAEFVEAGGTILENQRVIEYYSLAGTVTVKTPTKAFRARKAIFAAGSWLQSLMPEISKIVGCRPERIAVAYWRPKQRGQRIDFQPNRFPVFIVHNKETGDDAYGLPCVDYEDAIKFCDHYGTPFNVWEPNQAPSPKNVNSPAVHIEKHIPMLRTDNPAYLDRCKYTMSADKHYVVDFHPRHKNLIIAGCMSGSGFKVAPGIGRVAAHMAADKPLPYDMSFFSLKRFDAAEIAKL